MDYEQIFLELAEGSVYKSSKICEKLSNRFPEIGNEIVLPINTESRENNTPIFVFSQNSDFQIQGNFYNIIITISNQEKSKVLDVIKYIFEIFENECDIRSIACTFEDVLNINKIIPFKKNHIINIDTIDTDKIHFTMLREINVFGKTTRCLEGYSNINDNFISHFEFNMKLNDFKKLDYKYFEDFYFYVKKYKEGRKSCLL